MSGLFDFFNALGSNIRSANTLRSGSVAGQGQYNKSNSRSGGVAGQSQYNKSNSSRSGGVAGQGQYSKSGGPAARNSAPNNYPYDNGSTPPSYPGWSYGGGGGWGGGGGGGASGPSDQQKDAFDALGAVKGYEAGDVIMDIHDKANEVYDNADKGSRYLRDFQLENVMKKGGSEWFSNMLKQQSTTKHLQDVQGNNGYGIGFATLTSDMKRYFDAISTQVLESIEQGANEVLGEYAQALNTSINGSNENLLDSLGKLRQGYADYVTQGINIHPDLVNGKEDGYDNLMDSDNHDLNTPPEWLVPKNYWKDNFRKAVDVERQKHIRPDAATEATFGQRLNKQPNNRASSANKRYWDALGSYSMRSR